MACNAFGRLSGIAIASLRKMELFSCLPFVSNVYRFPSNLFPVPLDVIGRLCSGIAALPGYLHY